MAERRVQTSPDFRAKAGEDITAGEVVAISATDGLAYLACAATGTEELPAMGVAGNAVDSGEIGVFHRIGQMDDYSSLNEGSAVYVSNTAGEISTTAGDTSQEMGIAVNATKWIIDPEIIAAQTQH